MGSGAEATGRRSGAGRLVLAAYVTFVLPFLCWGAAGTPGHPHARPHVVFLPPQAATAETFARSAGLTAAELVAGFAERSLCGGDHTAVDTHATSETPAGRSVPAVLGFMLLVTPLLAAAPLEARLRPGFARLFGVLSARTITLLLATPPPRVVA